MCGIFGLQGKGARVDLDAALNVIRRRGPDDQGRWIDPQADVTLGHVRLSIQDPTPAGHQPMVSADGRVVMVFNGEIYNFHELRCELEAVGQTFHGHSDSEVLLALFCHQGIDCLARLNGIFAVAFWERDTRRLWLARDPLGVKPFYIHQGAGQVSFSSEMKALLRSGACKPELDSQAVLAHLGYLWSPGERTIVSGIRKLLPGQAACVEGGRVTRRWLYADLAFGQQAAGTTVAQSVEQVAQAVRTAVQRQMVSDVPLGAFLSGGLDSSAVVAFAREAHNGPGRLQCFSIRIDSGSTADEGFAEDLPYAQRVAKHLDVDLHVVGVGEEMMDRLPEMVYLLDEPTPDPAALNALFISELARSHGIKVLLSGAGGDDIFTGYRRHFALQQERWWSWLPTLPRQGLAALTGLLPASHPLGRRVGKAFRYAGLDADHRLASYFMWLEPSRALGLLSADFRAGLDEQSLFAPLIASTARLPAGTEALNRMLYLECKHFLADHNLNYTDKMGMAAGVEVRVPLLDFDLVALAGSLPTDLKQKGAVGKWIFKRAMEPYLPHDVIYRPKTGFGVPLRRWLQGRLRPLVEDTLSSQSIARRGVFDAAAVQALLRDDRNGTIDASYSIFGLVCMELWCRQYLDGHFALDAAA